MELRKPEGESEKKMENLDLIEIPAEITKENYIQIMNEINEDNYMKMPFYAKDELELRQKFYNEILPEYCDYHGSDLNEIRRDQEIRWTGKGFYDGWGCYDDLENIKVIANIKEILEMEINCYNDDIVAGFHR